MSATLSQLADEYGITKVTAKSRLVSLGLFDDHAVKQGRAFSIDDYAVEEFAKHYEKAAKRTNKVAAKVASASSPTAAGEQQELVAELRSTIEFLKKQLAQKDDICSKQLAEKDEQIARRDEQISQLIAK